jgi:hypothetical protein
VVTFNRLQIGLSKEMERIGPSGPATPKEPPP